MSAERKSSICAVRLVALALVLALPFAAFAQPSCGPNDTVANCFGLAPQQPLFLSGAEPAGGVVLGDFHGCEPSETIADCAASFQGAVGQAQLASVPTSPDTAGANLATNKRNFLPLLTLTGLFNEGAALDDSGTLVIDFDPLLGRISRDLQVKLLANPEPRLNEGLLQALPEGAREALSGQLEAGLGELDDTAIQLTYGLDRRLFGRQHGRRFERYSTIFQKLSALAFKPDLLAQQVALAALAGGSDLDQQLAAFEKDATQSMSDARLDEFYKLVDNQPQLHLSAEHKSRDSLVGPEELGFKVTYEYSEANVNRLLAEVPCVGTAPDHVCLDAYRRFIAERASQLDQGDRFSFSAEYLDVDDAVIDPALDGIEPIVLEAANKLIVSAGWSRRFGFGEGDPILLDLVAEYQDVSDDPLRRDRGVVTLTLTRNFAGVAVPFGIVYANHGEFLGEVDERLSAHVGLKFNAFGKPKEK